jgi:3-hydroxyisobutyrate dehydrogenase-like beta-hydroxyacid dehydrogenase
VSGQAAPGTVGVVGLGSMGSALANRLLDQGASIAVYNRTAARAEPFRARRAEVLACPAEVARRASIVLTCVTDEHAVGQVLLGPDGILHGAAPGLVLLETSTIGPDASAGFAPACAEAGVAYLRAPISGSVAQAASGSLTFLVSGPRQALDTTRPVLELLAARVFYLGEAEEGRAQKLALLLVVGATVAAVSEALVLGEKAGLDWRSMLEVFESSAVASPLVRNKVPTLAARDFAPGAATRLLAKDFDLILGAGRSTGTPLPLAALVRQLLAVAMSGGQADLDFSALIQVFEALAGLHRPPEQSTHVGKHT